MCSVDEYSPQKVIYTEHSSTCYIFFNFLIGLWNIFKMPIPFFSDECQKTWIFFKSNSAFLIYNSFYYLFFLNGQESPWCDDFNLSLEVCLLKFQDTLIFLVKLIGQWNWRLSNNFFSHNFGHSFGRGGRPRWKLVTFSSFVC